MPSTSRRPSLLTPTATLTATLSHLAFEHAGHADRFDQIVDRTGRDAMHVGLLHNRGERLLGQSAWFQEAGK
jgi:hypothetical protein